MNIRLTFILLILYAILVGVLSNGGATDGSGSGQSFGWYWIVLPIIGGFISILCYYYKVSQQNQQGRLQNQFTSPQTPNYQQFLEKVNTMKQRILGQNDYQLQEFVEQNIYAKYKRFYTKHTTYELTFTIDGKVYGQCRDDSGHLYVQGYYRMLKNTSSENLNQPSFSTEWIESPEKIPLDPETNDLDLEEIKKIVKNTRYYTKRLKGIGKNDELPEWMIGYHEASTGGRGESVALQKFSEYYKNNPNNQKVTTENLHLPYNNYTNNSIRNKISDQSSSSQSQELPEQICSNPASLG